MIVLNVELKVGRTEESIPLGVALGVINHFFPSEHVSRMDGDTLIVVLDYHKSIHSIFHPLYAIAQILAQDCIAAYNTELSVGALIGPRADEWGGFDKTLFIDWEDDS